MSKLEYLNFLMVARPDPFPVPMDIYRKTTRLQRMRVRRDLFRRRAR